MDEQDRAEALDGEVLGEAPDDELLPGTEDYPPDHPLGAEDPSFLFGSTETPDDVDTRLWRGAGPSSADRGVELVRTDADTVEHDDEAALVADDSVERADQSGEDAAVHVDDPENRPGPA